MLPFIQSPGTCWASLSLILNSTLRDLSLAFQCPLQKLATSFPVAIQQCCVPQAHNCLAPPTPPLPFHSSKDPSCFSARSWPSGGFLFVLQVSLTKDVFSACECFNFALSLSFSPVPNGVQECNCLSKSFRLDCRAFLMEAGTQPWFNPTPALPDEIWLVFVFQATSGSSVRNSLKCFNLWCN